MSSLLNSTPNGSTSNLLDSGRPFTTSFSAQSATAPVFHHSGTGTLQGLHNLHGSFGVQNVPGSFSSRNSGIGSISSGAVQQQAGNLSGGRFASSNIPVAFSQISHGSSHGHSGVTRGGLGASPMINNAGSRITSSIGNIVGGGNVGRSLSSGGISLAGLSRANIPASSGSCNLGVQGPSRYMGGVLQQAPHMLSMLGGSYSGSGGPLSHNQLQGASNALNSLGMMSDVNDNSPFDLNDFPQLTGRPNSGGGPQGQIGSLRKQGVGVSSIVQQSQEFSIQNEDFPALPGFKGGSSDYSLDMHQKEHHIPDAAMGMMQSQHLQIARSTGFGLGGATYASHRQQPQQHLPSASVGGGISFSGINSQDHLHLQGSELFAATHGAYHSQFQNTGPQNVGLRPLNAPNSVSGIGSYDQLFQQYHQQSQAQLRSPQSVHTAASQMYRDRNLKSLQSLSSQSATDKFSLLGVLNVISMTNPDLTSLALGIDLTTLGLNLNSTENLHKTFGSPWADGPVKGDPEYVVPECYYAQDAPPLQQRLFSKYTLGTLFYIFYSTPKDEAQLFAAAELYNRGWFYHKEQKLWLAKTNTEPLVKTSTYERGSYLCFDPNIWDTLRKDHFVLQYEHVEKKPSFAHH